jgi:hypothetical protein
LPPCSRGVITNSNLRFAMIQRIQTLWLFLAGSFAFLTLVFPTYSGYVDSTKPHVALNGLSGGLGIMLLTVLAGLFSLVAIGLFKNRKAQLYLCLGVLLAEVVLIYLYYGKTADYKEGNYAFMAILHPAILVMIILAVVGIRKDEKLLRESDRLR